jgi:hypothetical protein
VFVYLIRAISGLKLVALPLAADSSQIVTTPGSGLVFDNTYNPGCTAGYENCIVAAETQLERLFTNAVTINVTFNESNLGPGDYAENTFSWTTVSYAALESKLPSTDVLPSSDPNPTGVWNLPEAYARMLGLSSSTPTTDDTVTLNDYYAPTYGQDVINAVMHELTEGGMGRVGGLGDQNGVWSTMDLFRYTASGSPDYSDGRDGVTTYFSSNGGVTTSESAGLSFNNEYTPSGKSNSGDVADWTELAVFGTTQSGETLTLTQTEINVMAALGWKVAAPVVAYTAANVNGWFQTIDGLPSTTAPVATSLSDAYVAELNSGTQTPAQIQANLENPEVFYRTNVADFVLREFQASWGVLPTTTQYEAWVARVIAAPTLASGGMSMALAGSSEFMQEYGTTSATEPATTAFIDKLWDNVGLTGPPGSGALANVGTPVWQVLQNFVTSQNVIASIAGPIVTFQNALLESVSSVQASGVGSDTVQLIGTVPLEAPALYHHYLL